MVFRANTVTWINLVASLLVGTAAAVPVPLLAQEGQQSQRPGAGEHGPTLFGDPAPTSPGQGNTGFAEVPPPLSGRPSQAHIALNRAIEAQRRGDFEAAAPLFQEALQRRADLTPTEQRELTRLLPDNAQALQGRRDAAEHLRQAEKAQAEGRKAEVQEQLKKVAVNEQYLTTADRQRYQTLSLNGRPRGELPAVSPAAGDAAIKQIRVREQVRQARQLLGQYQFEAAEKLAQEADRTGAVLGRGEDTPAGILQDVSKARSDPKSLLAAARAALQRQEFDRAEQYATLSSQIGSSWSLNLWGDSPAKVLKDVQAARSKAGVAQAPRSTPSAAATPASVPATGTVATTSTEPNKTGGPDQPKDAGSRFGLRNLFGGPRKPDAVAQQQTGTGPDNTKPQEQTASPVDNRLAQGPVTPASLAAGSGPIPVADLRSSTGMPASNTGPRPTMTVAANSSPAANQPANLPVVDGGASLRSAPASPVTPAPAAFPGTPPPSTQPDETEAARNLIAQARLALQQGNVAQARLLCEKARSRKSTLQWWEDNPDRLTNDMSRLETQVSLKPDTKPAGRKPATKEEAVALLRQGRAQLAEGKLDDSTQTLLKLKSLNWTRWGLFEDTPDKLRLDLDKARTRRDQEESVKVLAEARRLYEQGDYENATRACYRAQKLHGAYSVWDLSDRPSKLLAEVDTAKEKRRKGLLPDAPVVVKNTAPVISQPAANITTGIGSPVQPVSGTVGAQANRTPQEAQARQLLADARAALQKGDKARARLLAEYVRQMPVTLKPGEDNADAILRDLDRMAQGRPANPAGVNVGGTATPQNPVGTGPGVSLQTGGVPGTNLVQNPLPSGLPATLPDPSSLQGSSPADATVRGMAPTNRLQAQQLLALARQLQRDGRLIEARQKALEAQRLRVPFGPDEDSPELALLQLASVAGKRIDLLMRDATELANYGKEVPLVRYATAEKKLQEARQLVVAYGQDGQPVEGKLQWLQGLRILALNAGGQQLTQIADPGIAQVAHQTQATDPPNPTYGMKLLEQARLDLRSGDTGSARRKAIEACEERYGVRDQALALIRTIDAEETNQRALGARRGFDAAYQAFLRKDYNYAGSIVAVIDPHLLDQERREKLKNMMSTAEMSPNARSPIVQAGGPLNDRGSARPGTSNAGMGLAPAVPPGPLPGNIGQAPMGDAGKPGLLETTQAMREIAFQKLRTDGMKAQSEAAEKFRGGQTDEALVVLDDYLKMLADSQLDPNKQSMLRRPIENKLEQFKILKAQTDFRKEQSTAKAIGDHGRGTLARAEDAKQKKIAELMKEFNTLFKDGKYLEAETAARKAHEMDPDNEITGAAIHIARNQYRQNNYEKLKENKEAWNLGALNDTDKIGPADIFDKDGISYDQKKWEIANKRGKTGSITSLRKSDKEREIEHRLNTPVNLNFTDTPLRQVIDDLRNWQGINIWIDDDALRDEGVSVDRPVTIKVEMISLKSALNLLLRSVHLTYVIKDEVLQITTERQAQGKLVTTTYLVADLVIPVLDFGALHQPEPAPFEPTRSNPFLSAEQPVPLQQPFSLGGGTATGTPSPVNSFANQSSSGPTLTTQGPSQTQEKQLIELITRTCSPRQWYDMGGPGTIDYFPLTMALVVNQTPDIQEQVADLLQALRRLQDQEVSVEVRIVSIAEDFYERIGVNFNMNFLQPNAKFQPQLTQGSAASPPDLNVFAPARFLSGLTPAGTLTNDLNIPITNSSFNQAALPFFGGYPGVPGYGGITLGLAFLSDIQVFLFMEAAQGDTRTNVMQAPKLTLFNGQTANLQVQELAPFVTNVTVVNQGGNILFQPQVIPLNNTVTLLIQAVISADRRFVRLSLQPTLRNIVPGPVNLFPIVVPIFPQIPNGGQTNPIVFTQFIQQPNYNQVTVGTTVAVPDGGTVVLGGLKRLAEARSEFGPPILSKLPYIDRLFKNVAYGREAESILLMVTPRIIIQEEEQERQTGFQEPSSVNPG